MTDWFRRRGALLLDFLLIFLGAAMLVRPLFNSKYLSVWASIESTFIADARFLRLHWPHPLWQPLWYGGTRFDYVYPPLLRYGTALLSFIYVPVKAYHVFIGTMFSLGIVAVYFMVRAMGMSRLQAWFSATAAALVSPSFIFITDVRRDSPHFMPQRLNALVRYGEGPHISSLSLLPFALGFAFLGLRRGRTGSLVLAGIFSALVSLTNFYGATALAIFYPILAWSVWITYREERLWLRVLAIPVLAYALASFWLTPAYLKITLYNMRYVSQPGNEYSYVLAIVTILLFGFLSYRLASHKPHLVFTVFVIGGVVFMGLNVLGHYYFNFRVLGEPGRLIPELDLAIILAGIEGLRRLWKNPSYLARGFVIIVALATATTQRHFVRHAWEAYPKEPDYTQRVEYQMSDWVSRYRPDARTMVTGSTRFWWDAWHDNAEVGGGSDQGLENPNPGIAMWEIILGRRDPELSVPWLKALGADVLIVNDKHSQDEYRDINDPDRFRDLLPVLYDDHRGDVIYDVPRRYRSLARVLDKAGLDRLKPIDKVAYIDELRAYSTFVETGPDVPTTTHWDGTDAISVHAPVQAGQSILVQVTYDPAWRAYAGDTELPVRADAMDFMAVDAPPGTQDIRLVFEKSRGNRVGDVLTLLAILLCLYTGFLAVRPKPAVPLNLR